MSTEKRNKVTAQLNDVNADLKRINTYKAAAKKSGRLPNLETSYTISVASPQEKRDILEKLNALDVVKYAEPVLYVSTQALPNDRYADPEQNNEWTTGTLSSSYADLWGLDVMNMKAVWDTDGAVTGNTITVAVIDTGIDAFHEDIQDNLWRNESDYVGYDFVNDDNYPVDGHGHGTHVAGTIAAQINNDLGITGVAPGVKIMSLKALSDSGGGTDYTIARAIEYAADNGADIINMSLGGYGYSSVMEEAVQYATALGAIVVAAAGNSADDANNYSPAMFDDVVTVGNIKPDLTRNPYSNYGSGIEVVAPGTDIISLRASGTTIGTPLNDNYTVADGTSMAAPHVAGALALLKQHYPEKTPYEVQQILYQSAKDLGEAGKDDDFGYGLIDAYAALNTPSLAFGSISSPTTNSYIKDSVVEIRGSAYSGTFTSYTVAYKKTSGSAWTTLITSSTEVHDGILGNWNTDSLDTGSYQLKLSITTDTDTHAFVSGPYVIEKRLHSDYPISVGGGDELRSHPVLHTTDSDVLLLALNTDNLYALNVSDETPEETFTGVNNASKYFSSFLNRAVTLGDIDHDGDKETVIGGAGTITIIESDGSLTEHDITETLGGNFLINKVILSDIDQDTKMEIIFNASGLGIVVMQENEGELNLYSPYWPASGSFSDPLVADMDEDGEQEILALSQDGTLLILDHYANRKAAISLGLSDSDVLQDELFVGDIDADGDMEVGAVIINYGDENAIEYHLYHHDGTVVSGWPFRYLDYFYTYREAPVIADITGDGRAELIAAQSNWYGTYVFYIGADGSLINGRSTPHLISTDTTIHSTVLVADVNNDAINDVILGVNGEESRIVMLNANGDEAAQDIVLHDVTNPYYSPVTLVLGDIEGNSKLDIMALVSNNQDSTSSIYRFELDAPLQSNLQQYLSYRGSEQLTGLAAAPLSETKPVSTLSEYLRSNETMSFKWSLPGYTPSGINVTITPKSEPGKTLLSGSFTTREVTISELNIEEHDILTVTLQAFIGDEKSAIRTLEVRVDTSAPNTVGINISHPSQHIALLDIDATDPETGISGFVYGFGSEEGLLDIKHWTEVEGLSTTLDISSFVATDPDSDLLDKIYVQAKSINGALNESSDTVTGVIDMTYLIPEAPVLTETNAYQSDQNLQFIDWLSGNSVFELSEIEYGLGTSPIEPDITGWKRFSADESRIPLINQGLEHGTQYAVFAKAINSEGLVSEVAVKALTIDITPPTSPEILEGLDHISSSTVTFSVTSTDNESNIKQHWVAVGSEIHLNDIIEWQAHPVDTAYDLSYIFQTRLHHLPYFYVKIKSENNAGLLSDSITKKLSTDIETPTLQGFQINGQTVEDDQDFMGFLNISFQATDNTAIRDVTIELLDTSLTVLSSIEPSSTYGSVYLATFSTGLTHYEHYSIRIRVSDDAGNTVYYASPQFRYIHLDTEDTNPPAIHSIEVNNKTLHSNDILTDSLNFALNVEDNVSISTVTLVLKDNTNNIIAAVVAEKQGSAYVASFDKSLFTDNYKYEVEIIAKDISANEISAKHSFTFAEVETFEVSNILPYPNPFNPDLETSKIRFNLEGQSVVKLYIHSITGKRLYNYSAIHETGTQILEWDGRDDLGNNVAMGVYFAYLIVESTESSDSIKKVLKLAVKK
jgi:subtilisin family serine protease